MKLIDKNPKKNPAILDNFMIVPDKMTAKQEKALNEIRKLLKWELKEKADAKAD